MGGPATLPVGQLRPFHKASRLIALAQSCFFYSRSPSSTLRAQSAHSESRTKRSQWDLQDSTRPAKCQLFADRMTHQSVWTLPVGQPDSRQEESRARLTAATPR